VLQDGLDRKEKLVLKEKLVHKVHKVM